MRPFNFENAALLAGAVQAADGARGARFLAGGTTLIDLMNNAFKIELGKRTLARALREAAALEI